MPTPVSSRPAVRGQTETLPWQWAEERLLSARNYWLSTASPEHGPYARPVWGVWCDEGLLFTASATSRKMRDLRADPRVAVHPELEREVVVVEGTVAEEREPGEANVAGYDEKYGWRPPATQVWYVVRPRRAYAAVESSYPAQATDFDF